MEVEFKLGTFLKKKERPLYVKKFINDCGAILYNIAESLTGGEAYMDVPTENDLHPLWHTDTPDVYPYLLVKENGEELELPVNIKDAATMMLNNDIVYWRGHGSKEGNVYVEDMKPFFLKGSKEKKERGLLIGWKEKSLSDCLFNIFARPRLIPGRFDLKLDLRRLEPEKTPWFKDYPVETALNATFDGFYYPNMPEIEKSNYKEVYTRVVTPPADFIKPSISKSV